MNTLTLYSTKIEPADKSVKLWFMSSTSKGAKIRAMSWNQWRMHKYSNPLLYWCEIPEFNIVKE